MTILVLGATGKTGRRLVNTLRKDNHTVRAASRSGETKFDWDDPGTWAPALNGVEAIYLVAPDDPSPTELFVKQAGARRIVVLSGRGMDRPQAADAFQGMAVAERAVRESDAEWTIIRPNNFNQNFDEGDWLPGLRGGRLALPIGDTPEPFIDVQDIADVAAKLLTSDGHRGQVYDLSGPTALTFDAAVATIAKVSGRSIRYEEITPEQYAAELLAEGLDQDTADVLNVMFDGMRAGHMAEPADGVQRVLGREPIDFATYATRAAAAWK